MHLRVAALVAFATLLAGSRAFAQDRGGFTALVNSGVGVQRDASIGETEVGLTGLNLGVGGFLTRDVALMFRLAGTNIRYDVGASGDYRQVSGVGASTLQYWVSDRFNIEAGTGLGFWSTEDEVQAGLGLILGTGVTIFNRGKHNLQFGVHYAPAFTTPATIHNIGFTFGYQFL
jgi:hypothetical protein